MLSEISPTQQDTHCDSTHMTMALEQSDSQRQKVEGGCWGRGVGGWGEGDGEVMGMEFQFFKMKKLWRWMEVMDPQNVSVLNVTELDS